MKRKLIEASSREEGWAILRDKFVKEMRIEKSEFFTVEHVTYKIGPAKPTLVEWMVALMTINNDAFGEEAVNRLIDAYQLYATLTIEAAEHPFLRKKDPGDEVWWRKLRDGANKVLWRTHVLSAAIGKEDLPNAVLAALHLQSDVMKLELRVKRAEDHAERGRENRDSMKKRATLRWEGTTAERQNRNGKWRREATRLRDLHPDWSQNRIAQTVNKNCPSSLNVTLRTILKVIAKKT